jgi:hypothetical protein
MVDITAVHLVGGASHEHIAEVRWRNPHSGETGTSSRQEMVKWLREGGQASVVVGNLRVGVGVVEVAVPYIRTHADGKWQDNLLALPRY